MAKEEQKQRAYQKHKHKPGKRKNRSCLAALILGMIEFVLIMVILPVLAIVWMNLAMIVSTHGNQVTLKEAKKLESVDMIVVLGASVHGNEPSDILKDRLNRGIKLYKAGVAKKILMTGDGQSEYYNEVRAMKAYAMKKGVPEKAILMDPNGLSTYQSMENIAREYDCPTIIIATQKYHMARCMYNAKKMGMEAYGCCANQKYYKNTSSDSRREIAARCKDYLVLMLEAVVEE